MASKQTEAELLRELDTTRGALRLAAALERIHGGDRVNIPAVLMILERVRRYASDAAESTRERLAMP